MGYVELPDQPPAAGGKLLTVVLDEQELRITVDLLKDALAELTRGMANGFGHAAAAPAGPTPAPAVAATAAQAGPRPATTVQQPVPASRAGLPAHLANMQAPAQAPPQQQAMRPPPQQQQQPRLQASQQRPPEPAAAPRPAPVPAAAPVVAPASAAAPRPQQQQQQRQAQPPPQQQRQQQQRQQPPPQRPAAPQQQQWQAPAPAPTPAPQQAVGAVNAAPSPASSHWKLAYTTEPEEHGGQTVAAVAYARAMPGLPGGDGHSGWLVSSSKGVLNLWETSRAVPGETVLLCMHSQAVDYTSTKLVLEPSTKLMFGASMAVGDASECVTVHSLDPDVGLLAYRYKFGPPVQQPKPAQQRLMQQVVSLHGIHSGVNNTVMTSYGERLLLFSTKDSGTVPANTLVHQSKMHFVAHQGSTITSLQTSHGIEGCQNLISGAMDGKIHIWDLSQPPRDNSPAMRLYRHTQSVTGLTQITDERLVSGSADGSVMLWDLRYTSGPIFTQRTPGNAGVMHITPGPWGDVMAVATTKGLHCVELFDFDSPMSNIADFPLQRPFTGLVFNAVTHDLYAGTMNGAISVFSRRA